MQIINKTLSLCPDCLKIIDADVVVKEGVVYLSKKCNEHGLFEAKHIWDSEKIYRGMLDLPAKHLSPANGLVINLTNNCNSNCLFCYSRANEIDQKEIGLREINKILGNFRGKIVYFSGGEPTISDKLIQFIKLTKKLKFRVGIFTNGKKLSDKVFVKSIKKAGVDLIIMQFDSLSDKNYKIIRGEPLLRIKMQAIENLADNKIPIYLFVMLINGVNTHEVGDLIKFVLQRKKAIKIINFNPVWEIGRVGNHGEFSASNIIKTIEESLGIKKDTFMESTKFAYYLSTLASRLGKAELRAQPRCELRCYIFPETNKVSTLEDLIDIVKINTILEQIFKRNHFKWKLFLDILYFTPYLFLSIVKSFFTKDSFRELIISLLKNLLQNILELSNILKISPFTSIIIGNFPTAYNLDFDFVKTCNLYSDLPGDKTVFSACIRQILVESMYSKNKTLDQEKLIQSYINKLL